MVTEHIDAIISEVNRLDDPRKRKIPLPDDALIARYEAATGFEFSEDYKKFLKSISNAFIGYLSPLTLNEEMGGVYGELRSAIEQGRSAGLPHDWLPICEDNGDYYCIAPDGKYISGTTTVQRPRLGPTSQRGQTMSGWVEHKNFGYAIRAAVETI